MDGADAVAAVVVAVAVPAVTVTVTLAVVVVVVLYCGLRFQKFERNIIYQIVHNSAYPWNFSSGLGTTGIKL